MIASSKVRTRFVVRNMIPSWYLSVLKKGANGFVAMDVLRSALLNKYIGFVKEKYGIPVTCQLKDPRKLLFQIRRAHNFAGGNLVRHYLDKL